MEQNRRSYTFKVEDVGQDFRDIFGRSGQDGKVRQVDVGRTVVWYPLEDSDQCDPGEVVGNAMGWVEEN